MSDILITNIDFPKGKEALALEVNRHGEVFVFYRDEASGRVAPLKRRESNAKEIPDKHGRCIDVDKFRKEVEAWRGCHTANFTFVDFLALLDNAPVVVEAST